MFYWLIKAKLNIFLLRKVKIVNGKCKNLMVKC